MPGDLSPFPNRGIVRKGHFNETKESVDSGDKQSHKKEIIMILRVAISGFNKTEIVELHGGLFFSLDGFRLSTGRSGPDLGQIFWP
jgi:hypothetical protein